MEGKEIRLINRFEYLNFDVEIESRLSLKHSKILFFSKVNHKPVGQYNLQYKSIEELKLYYDKIIEEAKAEVEYMNGWTNVIETLEELGFDRF